MSELPLYPDFSGFAFLALNEHGQFTDSGAPVPVGDLQAFFSRQIALPVDVTDVFVWVHGWKHDSSSARLQAQRMFGAIDAFAKNAPDGKYPALKPFTPCYVAVHWPSKGGYEKIRDRAASMTENGEAEFCLASLLGYLDSQNPPAPTRPSALRARGGYRVHCLGHSFGGRFLTAAITHAANPDSPHKLRELSVGKFPFFVDSLVVFQMAASCEAFGGKMKILAEDSPISSRIILTYSTNDSANCTWHEFAEGEEGIGCRGLIAPAELLRSLILNDDSTKYSFEAGIANVDASKTFGGHSDFWHTETIHLILSAANTIYVDRKGPIRGPLKGTG